MLSILEFSLHFEFLAQTMGGGGRGSAVGWGTAPQGGRWRVRFAMVSLEFFIDIILPALRSTQSLIEMSTRNISWRKRRSVRKVDNLATFMCRLSWNLGALTSWNPQGLSRPVMGFLYLSAESDKRQALVQKVKNIRMTVSVVQCQLF
jgi:hypothetical protein